MLLAGLAIIVGFIGLIWSADRFVAGAAGIARGLGMAPVMIGLTIVALGTSAPEIIVSINAALENSGAMAIGNALGSNLANVGLVLGITALIAPIPVAKGLVKREVPLLLLATLAAGVLLYDNTLSSLDGMILLALLVGILSFLVISKSHQPDAEEAADVEHIPELSTAKAWGLFLAGLLLLIVSSRILVWGAKEIALALGVSELIIGLTVIAVGTSLPELAATAASAMKGHHDIAIGNVVGSNLFNLLAVMAMPALIAPEPLAPEIFQRDYMAMAAITVLLVALIYLHRLWPLLDKRQQQSSAAGALANGAPLRHARIGRIEGILLLAFYAAYYYVLFSAQH